MKISHVMAYSVLDQVADAFVKMEHEDIRVKIMVLSRGLLLELLEDNGFKSNYMKCGNCLQGMIWGTVVLTVPMCSMSNPNEIHLYGDDCIELEKDYPMLYKKNLEVIENP